MTNQIIRYTTPPNYKTWNNQSAFFLIYIIGFISSHPIPITSLQPKTFFFCTNSPSLLYCRFEAQAMNEGCLWSEKMSCVSLGSCSSLFKKRGPFFAYKVLFQIAHGSCIIFLVHVPFIRCCAPLGSPGHLALAHLVLYPLFHWLGITPWGSFDLSRRHSTLVLGSRSEQTSLLFVEFNHASSKSTTAGEYQGGIWFFFQDWYVLWPDRLLLPFMDFFTTQRRGSDGWPCRAQAHIEIKPRPTVSLGLAHVNRGFQITLINKLTIQGSCLFHRVFKSCGKSRWACWNESKWDSCMA